MTKSRACLSFHVLLCFVVPCAVTAQRPGIQWNDEFGTPADDVARAITTDASHVYVVGDTSGTLPGHSNAGNREIIVRQYDLDGQVVWTDQFGTRGNDDGNAVHVDSSGVFVGGAADGIFSDGVGFGDAFLRKYDLDGVKLWTRQFGASSGSRVRATDGHGNDIFVVGGMPPGDAVVWRLRSGGSEVWNDIFGDPVQNDEAHAVATTASGIYVCGITDGTISGETSSGDRDGFLRHYDFDGAVLWTVQFGTSDLDDAHDLAANAMGIYVVGSTEASWPDETSAGGRDVFVMKFDLEGNALWTDQFGTTGSDNGASISLDSSRVYACGHVEGTLPDQFHAGAEDTFVRVHDFDGNEVATTQLGSAGNDRELSVTAGDAGVYLAATSSGSWPGETNAGDLDALVVRLSTSAGPERLHSR